MAEYSPTFKALEVEYSKSHFSPRLKGIAVLAIANSVKTQRIPKKSKHFLDFLFCNYRKLKREFASANPCTPRNVHLLGGGYCLLARSR